MSWNYRIMKKMNEAGEYEFGIYEVYYGEKGTVEGYTENSMTPVCSSEDDLNSELILMLEAFKKQTLLHT